MRIDCRSNVLMGLLAAVALTVSCGDDESNSNPTAPAPEEMVLATFSSAGSGSGPDEPTAPYAMVIEIGVADRELPGYEYPDPILFSNRTFGDDTNVIARKWDTTGLGVMAARLTDGEDSTVYVSMMAIDGGGSSSFGLESTLLTYEPGLSRVGPDLDGYTVTGVQVVLDIEVTQNGGTWTQAHECTISIIGY